MGLRAEVMQQLLILLGEAQGRNGILPPGAPQLEQPGSRVMG